MKGRSSVSNLLELALLLLGIVLVICGVDVKEEEGGGVESRLRNSRLGMSIDLGVNGRNFATGGSFSSSSSALSSACVCLLPVHASGGPLPSGACLERVGCFFSFAVSRSIFSFLNLSCSRSFSAFKHAPSNISSVSILHIGYLSALFRKAESASLTDLPFFSVLLPTPATVVDQRDLLLLPVLSDVVSLEVVVVAELEDVEEEDEAGAYPSRASRSSSHRAL